MAAAVCGLVSLVLLAHPATPGAGAAQLRQAPSPETLFVARRPGLLIKLWVGPNGILGSTTGSKLRCEGGYSAPGSITTVESYSNFPLRRGGLFKKSVSESYEGGGSYFWSLTGRVHPNRIVGRYTAWEELGGEEGDFPPRCGTRFPRGRPISFVAHRVAGPAWRGKGLAAAVPNHWVDGWCGDYREHELMTCETVIRHGPRILFEISSGIIKGPFRLCVTPPHGGATCHWFRQKFEWQGDEPSESSRIDFARHFPHSQRGRYAVRWYVHGRQRGEALRFFNPSPH